MRRILIIITFFISISGLVLGQSLPASPQGISANFSEKSIEVYQVNSQNKITEFFEYLTLYSNERNTELKKQIRENIYSLTESDMEIPNFLQTGSTEIDLDEFLSIIKNKSYKFHIKSSQSSNEIGLNDWVNSYTLSVIRNGKISDFKVNQIILFKPLEKQFGSKSKTVWEIKLGDIEMQR